MGRNPSCNIPALDQSSAQVSINRLSNIASVSYSTTANINVSLRIVFLDMIFGSSWITILINKIYKIIV